MLTQSVPALLLALVAKWAGDFCPIGALCQRPRQGGRADKAV